MLLAGDEFGRTQHGNNNAYCQDNEISWLDWNIVEKGHSLIRFVQRLTELRQSLSDTAPQPLSDRRVQRGARGVKDVTWINASGAEMRAEDWDDGNMHCFGMLMDGRAQPTGIRRRGEDATLLLVLNAHHDVVDFTLPQTAGSRQWSLLVDTNLAGDPAPGSYATGDSYGATGRSILLFALRADRSG